VITAIAVLFWIVVIWLIVRHVIRTFRKARRRVTGRQVVLRDERSGRDSRHLAAYLNAGDPVLEGQDLGPGTAPVSSDGEYEWVQTSGRRTCPT
jgi:hypothetical protein